MNDEHLLSANAVAHWRDQTIRISVKTNEIVTVPKQGVRPVFIKQRYTLGQIADDPASCLRRAEMTDAVVALTLIVSGMAGDMKALHTRVHRLETRSERRASR